MIIKLKRPTGINMGGKENKRKVRAIDSTGAFDRTVGNTFVRRFKDGNICVIRASILLG